MHFELHHQVARGVHAAGRQDRLNLRTTFAMKAPNFVLHAKLRVNYGAELRTRFTIAVGPVQNTKVFLRWIKCNPMLDAPFVDVRLESAEIVPDVSIRCRNSQFLNAVRSSANLAPWKHLSSSAVSTSLKNIFHRGGPSTVL